MPITIAMNRPGTNMLARLRGVLSFETARIQRLVLDTLQRHRDRVQAGDPDVRVMLAALGEAGLLLEPRRLHLSPRGYLERCVRRLLRYMRALQRDGRLQGEWCGGDVALGSLVEDLAALARDECGLRVDVDLARHEVRWRRS